MLPIPVQAVAECRCDAHHCDAGSKGGMWGEPDDPGSFYRVEKTAVTGAPGDLIRADAFAGAPKATITRSQRKHCGPA